MDDEKEQEVIQDADGEKENSGKEISLNHEPVSTNDQSYNSIDSKVKKKVRKRRRSMVTFQKPRLASRQKTFRTRSVNQASAKPTSEKGDQLHREEMPFGFTYKVPETSLAIYMCNFCTFVTAEHADFMQHALQHIIQCATCCFRAFTRLDVIKHTADRHPEKMSIFSDLQQLDINWTYDLVGQPIVPSGPDKVEVDKDTEENILNGSFEEKSHLVQDTTLFANSENIKGVVCTRDKKGGVRIQQIIRGGKQFKPAVSLLNPRPGNLSTALIQDQDKGKPQSAETTAQKEVQTKSSGRKKDESIKAILSRPVLTLGNKGSDIDLSIGDAKLVSDINKKGCEIHDLMKANIFHTKIYKEDFKYLLQSLSKGSNRYGCTLCDFNSSDVNEFKTHMTSVHNSPLSGFWKCRKHKESLSTINEILTHAESHFKAAKNFEFYYVKHWITEQAGARACKCSICGFEVQTPFFLYWRRMQPHRKWLRLENGKNPVNLAAMLWDVVTQYRSVATYQQYDGILKKLMSNIDKVKENWALVDLYLEESGEDNTYPLSLNEKILLLQHMKTKHDGSYLLEPNGKAAMLKLTRSIGTTDNVYLIPRKTWPTEGRALFQSIQKKELEFTMEATTLQTDDMPKLEIVKTSPSSLPMDETQSPPSLSLVNVASEGAQNIPVEDDEAKDSTKISHKSLLQHIEPTKLEKLDTDHIEMITIATPKSKSNTQCSIIYYTTTPQEVRDAENSFSVSRSEGVKTVQCKFCNKVLEGPNAIPHMKDHTSVHIDSRPYECAYCPKYFLRRSMGLKHLKKLHQTTPLLLIKRRKWENERLEMKLKFLESKEKLTLTSPQAIEVHEIVQPLSEEDSSENEMSNYSQKAQVRLKKLEELAESDEMVKKSLDVCTEVLSDVEGESKQFLCYYCSLMSETLTSAIVHNEEEHPMQDCVIRDLEVHTNTGFHRIYGCVVCFLTSRYKEDMVKHYKLFPSHNKYGSAIQDSEKIPMKKKIRKKKKVPTATLR